MDEEEVIEPTPEPTDPVATEETQARIEKELQELNDTLDELLLAYQEELQREETARTEEAEQAELNAPIEAEAEEAEQQYKDDMLLSLQTLEELNTTQNETLLSTDYPDYTEIYEEQGLLLGNQFMGLNVVIGLILGCAVAWAFIRGLVPNG